ncbi:MAG: hypothetical protein ACHQAY_13735 [Hyphomicrobiales bacterium]
MIGSIAAVVLLVAAGLALSAWSIRMRRGRHSNGGASEGAGIADDASPSYLGKNASGMSKSDPGSPSPILSKKSGPNSPET